MSAPYPLDILT